MGIKLENLAQYKFYPFVRRGLCLNIETKDNFGAAAAAEKGLNPLIPAGFELGIKAPGSDAKERPVTIEKKIAITAPIDITGIEKSSIVRTIPDANIRNFCPDYLAGIEFYDEDFLWRCTPCRHDDQTLRLRPWLTLLVLQEGEYTTATGKDGCVLTLKNEETYRKVMPNVRELWAFAHAQYIPDSKNVYASDPDLGLCRLLASRKLKPDTSYTAFLIPSFEAGRRAKLRLPMDGIDALTPAWNTEAALHAFAPLQFPVYHQWSFSTSRYGDFESLCEIITPQVADQSLAVRQMDFNSAAVQLNLKPEFKTAGFEGSLKPVNFIRQPGVGQVFEQKLTELLAKSAEFSKKGFLSSAADDQLILPPVYGATYQKSSDVMTGWSSTLNKDPRSRAAAAIGARIIRNRQDALVEQAWEQIDDINRKNEALRKASFAGKVSTLLMQRHIHSQDEHRKMSLTSMYHSRIPAGQNGTLGSQLHDSNCPDAVVSPAFRKSIRNRRRMQPFMEKSGSNYFEKSRKGTLSCAPATEPDPIAMNIDTVMTQFTKWADNHRKVTLAVTALFDTLAKVPDASWSNFKNVAAFLTAPASQPSGSAKNAYMELASHTVWSWKTVKNGKNEYGIRIKSAEFKKYFGKIYDRFEYENYAVQRCSNEEQAKNVRVIQRRLTEKDLVGMEETALKIKAVNARQNANPTDFNKDYRPVFDILQNSAAVTKMLDPASALQFMLMDEFGEEVQKTLAYPELDFPFYRELIKESRDLLIPNFSSIKENSLLLLEANTLFIESVLAGANTEMGKELLWREFPTDRRGSYFRTFWDKHDAIGTPDSHDVKKLTEWTGPLGGNHTDPKTATFVVLVVRADLFKSYPDTIVYALEAEKKANARTPNWTTEPLFPAFTAEVEDVRLFAFTITAATAKSGGLAKEGYFFLFQQRPGQMVFGLDAPRINAQGAVTVNTAETQVNELTWAHTVNNVAELPSLEHLRLFQANGSVTLHAAQSLRTAWQNAHGGSFATMLVQQPLIYARHATDLLP